MNGQCCVFISHLRKLEHEEHKQQKTQKELSAAEEKNSLAMEEVENYK